MEKETPPVFFLDEGKGKKRTKLLIFVWKERRSHGKVEKKENVSWDPIGRKRLLRKLIQSPPLLPPLPLPPPTAKTRDEC